MTVIESLPRAAEARALAPPPLIGRQVALRPVTPQDFGFLYQASMDPRVSWRWRWRGATPGPDEFAQALWAQVLVQFVVETQPRREPAGLVAAYNANFPNGYVHLAVMSTPEHVGGGSGLYAVALFLNYLFTTWNFRKVYLETTEFNYEQFRSGAGRFFEEEARLRDHEYFDGRYWDFLTLAIYRDTWERKIRALLPVILP